VHTAATVYVVVATANHFWLDGVVAVALLAISFVVQVVSRRLYVQWRHHDIAQVDADELVVSQR
jgi:hypothetical protein